MKAESIIKVLAAERAGPQGGGPLRATYRFRSIATPARPSWASSSAGRARRPRRSCASTSTSGQDAEYLLSLGHDPTIPLDVPLEKRTGRLVEQRTDARKRLTEANLRLVVGSPRSTSGAA